MMTKHLNVKQLSSSLFAGVIAVAMISCGGSGVEDANNKLPTGVELQFLSDPAYALNGTLPPGEQHSFLFSAYGTGTNQAYIAVNDWTSSPLPSTPLGNLQTFWYNRNGSEASFSFSGKVISNTAIIPGPLVQQQGVDIVLTGSITGLSDKPVTVAGGQERGQCVYNISLVGMAESGVPIPVSATNVQAGQVFLYVEAQSL